MNVKSVIAATPWIRRAWRVVPGPFRIPLLVVGGGVWLYKKMNDEEVPPGDPDAPGGAPVA